MVAIYFDKDFNVCISVFANEPKLPRKHRGVCGARTRQNTPCQAPPVWNKKKDCAVNGRCRLHGGLSTGPKTRAGREAIKNSNQQRAKNIKTNLY